MSDNFSYSAKLFRLSSFPSWLIYWHVVGEIAERSSIKTKHLNRLLSMKLIVSQLNALRTYVSREFYYIQSDLMHNHGWMQIETCRLWNASTIQGVILENFGELPETILFWEGYELLSARSSEIYRLPCSKFVMADDLHWWNEQMRQRKLVGFALCDMVLSTYGYIWDHFFPELRNAKRVTWIPHSASPDFLLQYNPRPKNAILLSGAITRHYPLRRLLKALHDQGSYAITHHIHPGYHTEYDYERNGDVGRGYGEKLNGYRVGFTDALEYRYVVAKYFEIPATGALLLADGAVSAPLAQLGFLENKHYVSASAENLEEKIRYVLDPANHEELDEIRRTAQKLVWERHKTSDRATQINDACAR